MAKIHLEINTIKINQAVDGLFIKMKLKLQKSPMNGFHGFILPRIKLKMCMNFKSMIGKNLTNLTRQVQKTLIIQIKIMKKKIKNIQVGKNNFLVFFIIFFFSINASILNSEEDSKFLEGNFIEVKILDKVSSKNSQLKIGIGDEVKFKNLTIKPLRCKNSKFDDTPEITAYLQVKDLTNKDNDEVFVFNGWTFSSSPTINPFDHPVYDIWLINCY